MLGIETVRPLFSHMEWADAVVWRAVLATPAAEKDTFLRERLYHIHLVQRAFLYLWSGRPLEFPELSAFADLAALSQWGRECHGLVISHLMAADDGALDRALSIPWVKRFEKQLGQPAQRATTGETMLQVTSHSTYHRGQVNARLRELGAEPPLTDFIAWVWLAKPAARWPEAV